MILLGLSAPVTILNSGGLTGTDLVVWPDALPVARDPLGMTPESGDRPADVVFLALDTAPEDALAADSPEGDRERTHAATASQSADPQSLQTEHGTCRLHGLQRGHKACKSCSGRGLIRRQEEHGTKFLGVTPRLLLRESAILITENVT